MLGSLLPIAILEDRSAEWSLWSSLTCVAAGWKRASADMFSRYLRRGAEALEVSGPRHSASNLLRRVPADRDRMVSDILDVSLADNGVLQAVLEPVRVVPFLACSSRS